MTKTFPAFRPVGTNRTLPNGSLQSKERSVFFSVDFAERRSVDLAECKSSLRLAGAKQAHRAWPRPSPSAGPEASVAAGACRASRKPLLPPSLAIRLPARLGQPPGYQSADLGRSAPPSFNKASCEIYRQTV